ncbi:MAG TPA: right-handed parallel beta-helix repeat-containing protein, partial [Anaerolineae bacterium]|nr:right-handed parallel beta-helix repeat-containing protein [Anaerolineae bacterium]
MLRRILLTGAVVMLLTGVLLGGWYLLSAPAEVQAATPPPTCQAVDQDIAMNVTWSQACYRVITNTVSVLAGAKLTISPGTIVYFDAGSRLRVAQDGGLSAVGTVNAPILFTSSAPSPTEAPCDWEGILIESDAGPGVHIEYAVVEYACGGVNCGGRRGLTLAHNVFRYNGNPDPVNRGGAIIGDTDDSLIEENLIHDCEYGILLNESGYNTVRDNQIHTITEAGIALLAGGIGGGSNNLIELNAIYDCGADGIRLEDGSSNQVLSNTLYSTMIASSHWGGAVSLFRQSGAQLRGNHVYHNGGGSGYQASVYVSATPDFANNQISANVLYNQENDTIEYAADNGNAGLIAQNNALCALAAFELRDDDGSHLFTTDARYNRWGFPEANAPTNGVNFTGLPQVTPWITLSIPASDAHGIVTVTLRGQEGASFFTVPRTPTALPVDSPIPNARRVTLTSNWGHFEPSAVLLNDQGLGTARLVPSTTVPAPAQIILTATDFCNGAVNATLALPDLAITKTALSPQAPVGGLITYRIDYANEGNAAATGIVIRDTLPVGMQWVADTAVPPWTRAQTSPEVVWTLPTLAAGARGSFLVTTTVTTDDACGLQLTNLVVVTGTTLEARLDNNADSAEPVTILYPDVAIRKTTTASTVTPGGEIAYTLTYSNAGAASAVGIRITDTLPANTTFVRDTCGGVRTQPGPGIVVWTLPDLAPHTQRTCEVVVRTETAVCAQTVLASNVVDIGTTTPECNLVNNHADTGGFPITVVWADVAITKTVASGTVLPGGTVVYTLLYANQGTAPAANVRLTDTLPANTTLLANTCGAPNGGSGVVSWAVSDLAPGASRTCQLTVQTTADVCAQSALGANAVVIGTSTPECGNTANNRDDTGEFPITVVWADVAITKTVAS